MHGIRVECHDVQNIDVLMINQNHGLLGPNTARTHKLKCTDDMKMFHIIVLNFFILNRYRFFSMVKQTSDFLLVNTEILQGILHDFFFEKLTFFVRTFALSIYSPW